VPDSPAPSSEPPLDSSPSSVPGPESSPTAAPGASPWTPPFTRFFLAQSLSWLGSSMTPVALSFGVLRATGRTGDLGVVLAANTIPMIVFLLLGGVVADRLPRGRLLVLTHAAAALTQAATAVWFFLGTLPLAVLLVVTALNGFASAFTGPALRGIVPELVPTAALERANAARTTSKNAFRLLGPSAAGMLVAFANAGWALAIDATCLIGAAVLLATLRSTSAVPEDALWTGLRNGSHAFFSRRWLWSITASFFVVNLGIGAIWLVMGPVVARDTIGAQGWGVVLGLRAAGLIVGGLLASRFLPRRPLVWVQLTALPYALAFAALALAPTLPILLPLALLVGIGSAIEGVQWESTLQRQIRPEVLSRVASYDMLGSFASVPLGQLLAAPLAALVGIRPMILVATIAFVVAVLAPLLVREVRTMGREAPMDPARSSVT
jgi:MFS family permease